MATRDDDTRKAAKRTGRQSSQGVKPSDDAEAKPPKRADEDKADNPPSAETQSVIIRPPGVPY